MPEALNISESSVSWFPLRALVFWTLVVAGAVGLFGFTRNLTICWRLTALPGTPPAGCADSQVAGHEGPVFVTEEETAIPSIPAATPKAAIPEVEYPTWDGGGRINILFVGLRGGDPLEGDCPFCTDTLILLTVDPLTKTAGMLSIPRDMWVNIPGFGYSRINTAWMLGRGSKLPGGGPALTMKTISHFIGVPVDYYVQVDFDTFIDVIDLLGGVDVYNDETLLLDPMSHGKDFPKVKLTCCGLRHLNGRVTLAYARCRHVEQGCKDGDIGRARRQQKVIFAIREKVLNPENFPTLLAQAPQLYNTFSEGIHTNLTLDDAIKLAVLMRDIPGENIRNEVITNKMIIFDNVVLGGQNASILRPIPDQIRILRDQIFTASGPLSPLAQGYPTNLMQADHARIRILNGTTTPELDTRTGSYLNQLGMLVTEYGDSKASSRTTILLYSSKLYAFRYLLDTFGIKSSTQILIKPDPSQTVDIEIRLGKDWVNNLPVGY
ncbi:MAG TPA: LCP family protein [Anaerolineales bacterium]|nr:LCP family protein [Anaerolineales bacterium]